MIKLCVFDIDGVINSHDEKVDPKLFGVIEKIQQNGTFCTVATGKIYSRAVAAIKNFKPNAPLILENSGRITELNGRDIIINKMDCDYISKLRAVIEDKNILFVGFCPIGRKKMYFYAADSDILNDLECKYPDLYDEVSDDIEDFMESLKDLGCVRLSIQAMKDSKLDIPKGINWTLNKGFYNINAPGITKATGVFELADRLKIEKNEILVVGNDDNDRALFRENFGVKIAVKPCPEELIANSTHQLDDLNGLADLLQEVVLEK